MLCTLHNLEDQVDKFRKYRCVSARYKQSESTSSSMVDHKLPQASGATLTCGTPLTVAGLSTLADNLQLATPI